MMMSFVFTGTMRGTTHPQHESLDTYLSGHDRCIACHGLAIGADYEFHQLCLKHGFPVWGYPMKGVRFIDRKQADIPAAEFAVLFPAQYPLDRNRDMIDSAVLSSRDSQLIVCPKGDYEELRSGTWATVRYARSRGMKLQIIWPTDGALEYREPGSPHYHSRNRHVEVRHGSGEDASAEAGSQGRAGTH